MNVGIVPAPLLNVTELFRVRRALRSSRGVKLHFIKPGTPTQNAFIESFNGSFRNECLNANWFDSLDHARRLIEEWRVDYNDDRPHSSLGGLTPIEYQRQHQTPARTQTLV